MRGPVTLVDTEEGLFNEVHSVGVVPWPWTHRWRPRSHEETRVSDWWLRHQQMIRLMSIIAAAQVTCKEAIIVHLIDFKTRSSAARDESWG